MEKLTLSAGISGISSKVDRSYSLRMTTLELTSGQVSWLNSHLGDWGWIVISPNEKDTIEDCEVPTQPAKGKDVKSEAERLRAVLYAMFKQMQERGDTTEVFSTFYERKMSQIIEHFKEKLD